ncbi:serine hydrolase [Candidatus Woesearchaeota archaeon]|nr:serine hydrolase [Candidatus Woesearchaeota archaeon]
MRVSKKRLLQMLLLVLVLSLILNGILFYQAGHDSVFTGMVVKLGDIAEKRAVYEERFAAIETALEEYGDPLSEQISVYVEHLESGVWIGYHENEGYHAGSLSKLPIMMSIIHHIENGSLSLSTKIRVEESDIDTRFGPLGWKGSGYEINVEELLTATALLSDNTAMQVQMRIVSVGSIVAVLRGVGIEESALATPLITPKAYSKLFRGLYQSSYLEKEGSEYLLQLLSSSIFLSQIPAGVPEDIAVAHKIAIVEENKEYHDCGIVYTDDPYILCIMTKGFGQVAADSVMSNISEIVYSHVIQ